MASSLVIAVGNPLRSDDGLAWHAADLLSRNQPNDCEIVTVHQLTPELAEAVSGVHLAIFIDASADLRAGMVHCQEIRTTGENAEMRHSHSVSPAALLTLARTLYQASPRAFLITCGGKYFDHGDSLSDEVASATREVVAKIEELLATI
jgi:hydrogenase maturation protease